MHLYPFWAYRSALQELYAPPLKGRGYGGCSKARHVLIECREGMFLVLQVNVVQNYIISNLRERFTWQWCIIQRQRGKGLIENLVDALLKL